MVEPASSYPNMVKIISFSISIQLKLIHWNKKKQPPEGNIIRAFLAEAKDQFADPSILTEKT
jgi:hypothetical protein